MTGLGLGCPTGVPNATAIMGPCPTDSFSCHLDERFVRDGWGITGGSGTDSARWMTVHRYHLIRVRPALISLSLIHSIAVSRRTVSGTRSPTPSAGGVATAHSTSSTRVRHVEKTPSPMSSIALPVRPYMSKPTHALVECAQCGYPRAKLRSYEWGQKAKRRKTTGTGRMRYLKTVSRRFKNGFRCDK